MAYLSTGDPHFKFWVKSLGFRLLDDYPGSSWTEERIVFTSQENVMELRLYTVDVFRML